MAPVPALSTVRKARGDSPTDFDFFVTGCSHESAFFTRLGDPSGGGGVGGQVGSSALRRQAAHRLKAELRTRPTWIDRALASWTTVSGPLPRRLPPPAVGAEPAQRPVRQNRPDRA